TCSCASSGPERLHWLAVSRSPHPSNRFPLNPKGRREKQRTPMSTEAQLQLDSLVAAPVAVAAELERGQDRAAGLRRKAVRGGAILLATRLLTQLFLWAVTLTVARLLLPYDYGLMTTGLLFVDLADLLAMAGVSKALIQKETLEPADLAEAFTL